MDISKADIESAIREIKSVIRKAESYFLQSQTVDRDTFNEPEVLAEAFLEEAFVSTTLFVEAISLSSATRRLEGMYEEARKSILKTARGVEEDYLVWASSLQDYLDGIAISYNIRLPRGIVGNDVDSILRACAYSITDKTVYGTVPKNEKDVHIRIEGILKTFFPDLKHAPALTKPIKNFEPDTGLPSIKTLIEYKFITTPGEAKIVTDQILADTRGYFDPAWAEFVYVVYETTRIMPETDWNNLLRSCGVGDNARIIVLAGVPINS